MKLIAGMLNLTFVGTRFNQLQHCTGATISWSPKVQTGTELQAVDRQRLQGVDEGAGQH